MADYQLTSTGSVIRLADLATIPNDPQNSDYQGYLTWLNSGGVPDAADSPPTPPRMVTASQFLNLFLPQEQFGLAAAALQSPALLLLLITAAAATAINLDDPDVVNGVNGVVPGTLTQDRANRILAGLPPLV